MKSGTTPTRIDHRDYSFHKTFGRKAGAIPFPPSYNTDSGLTMPNQDLENDQFSPPVPPLVYGCTSYDVSEVAIDLGNPPALVSPLLIENVTQSNAKHGYDLRQAMLVGVKIGLYKGIFNVEAIGQDMFDAMRDAMISGGTERRSVAVASEWLPPFETVNQGGVLTTNINLNDPNLTWHAWKICGWETIGDQVYLVGKSWQGRYYGNGGLVYFSRPLFNTLMSVSGSVAFTATKGVLPPIQTINTTLLQWLISWARQLKPF